MTSRRTSLVRTGATLAVAALLAAGCSSSKSSPSASGTTAGSSSTSSSAADTSSPSTSASSSASGGQPSDVAGATQAVKDAYNKFFDNSISTATKAAMVQNAGQVQALLTALAAAANGEKSSIQVNTVTFDSPTHANVDFAILLNGQPALPHASGDAVYDSASGNWQVSDATLCKLAGITPGVNPTVLKAAGCS
ncbi:hypothetical protein Caci_8835 [Catenulispora acidiphila DSM 44928]|uniref:Low molecular weight antigen MTB12-like C-terminal domain-containing protein n=1 Tax=Catenulispora acidiphila (strain DSM 44928 / JCM 14897 / NBRC 102108 / NRRL B-24433 / ID139908) TaxID=479433 RepID=C7Q2B1_CATAD|nr:hypothetical protein [Catenulispora acidiphila]ACU77648.1 hypothetical protein Caci_8835 [Catenulispora acidiphila DSM 44928]